MTLVYVLILPKDPGTGQYHRVKTANGQYYITHCGLKVKKRKTAHPIGPSSQCKICLRSYKVNLGVPYADPSIKSKDGPGKETRRRTRAQEQQISKDR